MNDEVAGLILLKAMFKHRFYEDNKHRIILNLFPSTLHGFIGTLQRAHERYNRDLVLREVWQLYLADNPSLTEAFKKEISGILTTVGQQEEADPELYSDILKQVWKQEQARDAADKLLSIAENSPEVTIGDIRKIIDDIENENYIEEKVEYVSTDVDALIQYANVNYDWRFNIPPLNTALGGLGPGLFGIIAARPDVGKTCFIVNMVFGPGGFIEQGANVHIIANEEPGYRVMLRGVNAYTGLSYDELNIMREKFPEEFQKVRDGFRGISKNVFIRDTVDTSIEQLDQYCKDNKVDILIIDQLDKIKMKNTNDSSNDASRLKTLYVAAREIAKRRGVAVIGICQAGNDAHGKLYFGYDALDNSKTGKAGEADYILCIGRLLDEKANEEDNGSRTINIPKNKSPGGSKTPIPTMFNFPLSRVH